MPTVTCPDNILQYVPAGQSSAVVTWPVPTAWDNTGNDSVTVTSLKMSGSDFPSDMTDTVVVTASDPYENFGMCTFTVTVASKFAKVSVAGSAMNVCFYDHP